MRYRFILQDNTAKAYRLFTWFLFFFHIVAAGIVSMNAVDKQSRVWLTVLTVSLFVTALVYYLFRKQKKATDIFSAVLAVWGMVFWTIYTGWPAALLFGLVFLFVRIVQQKQTIVEASAESVVVKRAFGITRYGWNQLDNVILKDGLLTIDLASNKMIQAELTENNETVDEGTFNLFCREHLANNK